MLSRRWCEQDRESGAAIVSLEECAGASQSVGMAVEAAARSAVTTRGARKVREHAMTAAARYIITLEGHGEASGYASERVLVALERAQGFGKLKNLPRKLPVGCRRGGCGICRVRVTGGQYRADVMSRAHVSAEDEARGLVLACCIYPLSDLSLRLETPVAVKAGDEAALQTA